MQPFSSFLIFIGKQITMPNKVKKLPNLDVVNYVEVAQPRILKKLLTSRVAEQAWNDAIEDKLDYDESRDLKYLRDFNNVDPILLAKATKAYVDYVISEWTDGTTDWSTNQMIAAIPLFVEMSKYLPHVNPNESYNIAFRGTDIDDDVMFEFVSKNKNPSNWKKVKVSGHSKPYVAYAGPKKNLFTYKPSNRVQSWSVTDRAAANFGNAILATPLDKTFFFDPAFMNQYGFQWENETVHFGNEKMKVAFIIDQPKFKEIMMDVEDERKWLSSDSSIDEDSNSSQTIQITDEDGTLSMPM